MYNQHIYIHQIADPSIIFNYKKFNNKKLTCKEKKIEKNIYIRKLLDKNNDFFKFINDTEWNPNKSKSFEVSNKT